MKPTDNIDYANAKNRLRTLMGMLGREESEHYTTVVNVLCELDRFEMAMSEITLKEEVTG